MDFIFSSHYQRISKSILSFRHQQFSFQIFIRNTKRYVLAECSFVADATGTVTYTKARDAAASQKPVRRIHVHTFTFVSVLFCALSNVLYCLLDWVLLPVLSQRAKRVSFELATGTLTPPAPRVSLANFTAISSPIDSCQTQRNDARRANLCVIIFS